MDKAFWREVYKNKYEIPHGHTLSELTRELFSYLGSTDPELRDEIGYTFFANWLKQGRYSKAELNEFVGELLASLDLGIGEAESDTVFLRSFSALSLAEIVHGEDKKPLLGRAQIADILDRGLWYLNAEKDTRGYIPVKGWAHAIAHTADMLQVLAKNGNLAGVQLMKILSGISGKIIGSTKYIYLHAEDERLSKAISEVFRRDLIPQERIEAWMQSFLEPNWKGSYEHKDKNAAFQNTRNLLRSIYLDLEKEPGFPQRDEFKNILFESLNSLKPY